MDSPVVVKDSTERVVDSRTGIVKIRSSQGINDGIFESCIKSYQNLVQTPYVLLAYIILMIVFMTELNDENGPLEAFKKDVEGVENLEGATAWEKNLAKLFVKLLSFIIKYKFKFITLGLMWLPWMAKPSTKNLIMSLIFSILVMIYSSKWQLMDFVLLSQLYFLFTQLRSPLHKMLIVILGVVIFVVGIELSAVGVNRSGTDYKLRGGSSTTPSTTKKI